MEDEILIKDYLKEVKVIADSVSVSDIKKVVNLINMTWIHGGMIYICGNGGSASTASHFASDLLKVGLKVHSLDDNPAMITAITNDNGFSELYIEQIKNFVTKNDVLICISVHGGTGQDKAGMWSQNLVRAIGYIKSKGGKVIGLVGYDGGIIKDLATCSIVVGDSTPQVESWHVHIEHLICLLLKERIK